MLRLAGNTRETWRKEALEHFEDVLLDHAHCEKKAASSAISFLFRYPEYPQFMKPLSELAREELRHFEQVLQKLEERGWAFKRQVPSEYAKKLVKNARNHEPHKMLDLLICASLIEARSCERMKILSEILLEKDPSIAQFYRGLLACEARHHEIYLDLAETVFPREEIEERVRELAIIEVQLLQNEPEHVRMHS